jgi:hypothetical protein
MKRLSLLAAVLIAAAILVPTSGAAKPDPHAVKIEGIVKVSDIVLNDVKNDGPSPGDVYTFTLTGFDKTGKHQISKGHGYCVLGAPTFSTCTEISDDGKGRIAVTWEDDGKAATAEQVAITGGTRKYRTIRGDGSTKQINAADPTTFRIKLNGTTR